MPLTLATIKKDLEGRIGSQIMLAAQTGRKRQTERRGVLTETLSFSICRRLRS